MLQGVQTIGVTARTPDHEFGALLMGATGAVINLNDASSPVMIDWNPNPWDYVPQDYTFDGCVACP